MSNMLSIQESMKVYIGIMKACWVQKDLYKQIFKAPGISRSKSFEIMWSIDNINEGKNKRRSIQIYFTDSKEVTDINFEK